MWSQAVLDDFPEAGFREPAHEADTVAAEKRLGRGTPAELRQLFLESDGVLGHSRVDTVRPLEQVVEQNLSFWSDESLAQLYMPFGALLFFGDNGGGDRFAFVRKPERPDVFVWDHENDSRIWVAGATCGTTAAVRCAPAETTGTSRKPPPVG